MYYVYVLKSLSKQNKFYIGYSADLKARVTSHDQGQNTSTKYHRPWELIYYEAYKSASLARDRESILKQRGKTWQTLRKRLLSEYDT